MEAHAEVGHRMFAGSGVELLDLAAEMALTHHDRIEPRRRLPAWARGTTIPVEGRICAIADVFDALHRPRLRAGVPAGRARADAPGSRHAVRRRTCWTSSWSRSTTCSRFGGRPRTAPTEQTLAIALAHALVAPRRLGGSSAAPVHRSPGRRHDVHRSAHDPRDAAGRPAGRAATPRRGSRRAHEPSRATDARDGRAGSAASDRAARGRSHAPADSRSALRPARLAARYAAARGRGFDTEVVVVGAGVMGLAAARALAARRSATSSSASSSSSATNAG